MRTTTKGQRQILVNVGSLESRVAILEDGKLMELHVERAARIVGNIYKARVATVLPGMEAAFVDLGLERHGFLSAEEVGFFGADDGDGEGPALHYWDTKKRRSPIETLSAGQDILVQVNRAAIGTKGARVSARLALPGRYLVLLLNDAGRVGVSRKIESDKVRLRLKKFGEEICPKDCGLILRTESEAARPPQLKRDLELLLELKRRMFEKSANLSAPALVHEDLTLVLQIIRDCFTREVSRLLVDSAKIYENAREVVEMISPRWKNRVELYKEAGGLYERFGVEEEISKLWQRKVWLKAGGYISIDQAEALCAIDVNTARYTGRGRTGLSETILKVNLEAAEEIARQLRLRDIGGIIVIDFIDMESAAHRAKLLGTFKEALTRDRAKTRALSVSPLGLIEMTRKKQGESLLEKITDGCPECGGLGRVQNPVSISLHIQSELRRLGKEHVGGAFAVWAHPKVAALLVGAGGEQVRQMEIMLQRSLYIRADREAAQDYVVAFLQPGEVEEKVGSFTAGQQLRCRRLREMSGGTNFVVSEEGYLVELPGMPATSEEIFPVDLIKVAPGYAVGRGFGEEQQAAAIKRPGGIRRRGLRARQKKERAAKEQPALTALPPAPPVSIAIEPRAPEAAAPVSTNAPAEPAPEKTKRRRHRGGRGRGKSAGATQPPTLTEETVSEPYESDSAEPRIEAAPPAPVSTNAPAEPAPEKTKRRRHRGGRGRGKKAGAAQPATPTEEMAAGPYESDSAEPQLVAKATPVLTEAEPPADETESPQSDEAAKKSAPRRRHRSHRKKTAPPAEAGAPPEAGMIREDALAYMPSEATAVPQPTAEIHSDAPASVDQSDPSTPPKKPRRRYYKPRKKKETGGEAGAA